MTDGADFAGADLIQFSVGGLAIDVGDFDGVGAAEFEDAVGFDGVAEDGLDALNVNLDAFLALLAELVKEHLQGHLFTTAGWRDAL